MSRDYSLVSKEQKEAIRRDDPSSFSITNYVDKDVASSYISALLDLIVEHRAFNVYDHLPNGDVSQKMEQARDNQDWRAIRFYLDFLMNGNSRGEILRNFDEVRYLLTKGFDTSLCRIKFTPPMVYLIMTVGGKNYLYEFDGCDKNVSQALTCLEINITSDYPARPEHYRYTMLYDTIDWGRYTSMIDSANFYSMFYPVFHPILHRLIANQAYHILDRDKLFLRALKATNSDHLLLLKSMGFTPSERMINKLAIFAL